ncbi:hypothetical protein L6R53_29950 [Myxococcota bacterium]|nr:hypothetical protein [Myxococcota bacterium]
MRTFHLPLPDHLYDALRAESAGVRRPATELVREALETWLETRRRERLDAEIEAYARELAGTAMDLDPDLEAAAVDCLLAAEPSP